MKKNIKKDMSETKVKTVVFMEGISSSEHFLLENQEPRPVLEHIDLIIKREEAWGISGQSAYEIKLLLEIMANIRPYDKGRCVLMERGMLRHKRVIQQHVFYMGNADMVYNNMNVLEFLMFAMNEYSTDKVALQDEIFESIIDRGLGHIALTPNGMLTESEKAVVTLLAAAYSDSTIIVFNFPDYDFDESLVDAIAKIAEFIKAKAKSLIVGTKNNFLIQKACSHTAFLMDGMLLYQGTVERLRFTYDKILIIIRDKKIYELLDQLAALLPDYKLSIKENSLLISNLGEEEGDTGSIYKKIAEAGIVPDYIEINQKTVHNAYEEIILRHDLQK